MVIKSVLRFIPGMLSLLVGFGIASAEPVNDLGRRSSGVLLHVTALPSPHGVGDLGDEAKNFINFLAESKQRYWQILPIGQTDRTGGPYGSLSAFSGNPMLIDLDQLVRDGLLEESDITAFLDLSKEKVEFLKLWDLKYKALNKAYTNAKSDKKVMDALAKYVEHNKSWVKDFGLFMALRDQFNDASWRDWPQELIVRDETAVAYWTEKLKDKIAFHQYLQMLFDNQWFELKNYAHSKGVLILGDVPIYVSYNSVDVWANPQLFKLSEDLSMAYTAGVPPDDFAADGQNWMMPLYNWDYHIETNFEWWVTRFEQSLKKFDATRIDHFRGFEAFYQIPSGVHAKEGEWVKAPGYELFNAVKEKLGKLPFIAEDLGFITREVHELRESFGIPGMKILQFGMFGGEDNHHRPENAVPNSVTYTGTHDNSTVLGWFYNQLNQDARDYLKWKYNFSEDKDMSWKMIEIAWGTSSSLAVTTLQDILKLDDSARFNIPGTPDGNWNWRYQAGSISQEATDWLKKLTESNNR